MLNQGVGSWLNRRREKSRDSAALIFDGRSISYLELLERVDSLANALRERGVQKGSRIAYLGENHPSFLETFFASATLGAIFVPLNTRLAAAEINFSLLDSGSTVLVHSESLSHIAIPASEQTAVAHRIVDCDFASTDIALMISPMFHVASLGMGVLPTLLKGGTLVLEQKFDPARVLELIERHRVTAISGVPTTFQMLCEHPNWAAADLSSLNKLTCGGSAVPQRVAAAFEQRGLSFSGGYGMSETAPGATSLAPAMSAQKAGSAGLPHFFTEIRIVDEQGGILRSGEVGEIQIMGPNVIAEYWNRPEATQSSFADELWFRSGDLGYTDDEGFLFISDRPKDMIISGGENVYPARVEQVILERAEVATVAVFGVADEKWGEVPWAAVVLRDGAVLGADELRAHLELMDPLIRSFQLTGVFALPEPEHGSDIAGGLSTSARRDGDGWVINGQKRWIGGASSADYLAVFARDEADVKVKAFLVRSDSPGVTLRKIERKILLRMMQNSDIDLVDVRVDDEFWLQNVNGFFDVAGLLRRMRADVVWIATGVQAGAYEAAVRYVSQREQLGKPLASFQLVQEKLALMLGNVTASLGMVVRLSPQQEQGV